MLCWAQCQGLSTATPHSTYGHPFTGEETGPFLLCRAGIQFDHRQFGAVASVLPVFSFFMWTVSRKEKVLG